MTDETKRKISESEKGKIITEETKQKISKSQKGHIVTEETKKKISDSEKGKIVSEETKQKLSKSNEGKHHTDESKQKMSKSQKGKNHTDESKQKMSEAKMGHIVTEETKQKMSEAQKGKIPWNKGKPHTEETKQKISKTKSTKESKLKSRESALKYLETIGFTYPNIGRNEIKILDELELTGGYNILRQFRVGGFFLDGYIPELNLAIEVDEKYHKKQKEKDIQREEFIKKELGCEFLRIKDY